MNEKPLVSVIVPTKNSAKTLAACLQSLKKQTYPEVEIVVVDNHSSDETPKIAKEYTPHVFTKGPERSPQRNFGVQKSHGEYVMIIDSDMELTPKVVAACVEEMKKHPETKGIIIPEESFGIGFWAQCKRLERSFYVGVDWIEAARFFTKKVYVDLGGYDENMVSGEDFDLSQRVRGVGRVGRIKEFINHNEGHINLVRTIKKKYYYAGLISRYFAKAKERGQADTGPGTGIFTRYALFFKQPVKLFKNPILGLGMLYMKTCEFAAGGFGLIASRLKRSK